MPKYQVLIDVEARQQFDKFGTAAAHDPEQAFDAEQIFRNYAEVFRDFEAKFNTEGGQAQPARHGANVRVRVGL